VFAIAVEQQQYKTYILSDQLAQSRLSVVPDRGGIITSWQLRGQEILYLDRDRFANPELSIRGGVPILFPICGNLPDNRYTYSGETYTLKQHGFARDLPWQVVDRITHDRVGITLALTSSPQTRSLYPFDFEVALQLFSARQRARNSSAHLESIAPPDAVFERAASLLSRAGQNPASA
jgi:galactose mutarotase-like enzyme